MYEKYSGLPDTTKPAASKGGKSAERSPNRAGDPTGENEYMEYYRAPNRSGASSAKHAGARKAKARKRRFIVGFMGLVFLALVVVAIVLLVKSCAPSGDVDIETGRFRNGVYINSMDVSGKTIDEVREQLEYNESYLLNNIAIKLSSSQINAVVTGADMNAATNLNEVMQQALAGGANQTYNTKIAIDEAALTARIEEINQTSSAPPKDATVTFTTSESGKTTPQYTDGSQGYGLDVASTIELIKQAVESGDTSQLQSTLTPTVTTVDPAVTVDDLKAFTAQIGKYTTTFDYKGTAEDTEEQRTFLIPNRAYNVEKAADKINGQVVQPGKTWSFNDVVGDRTLENGWKEANGIFGGDTLTHQPGGGVCQVSTTLFNALLQAYPYFTFDRTKHSFPSTYVGKGLDATVDSNHIDFKFTNNTDYPVCICAYVSENKMAKSRKKDLTVIIYGQALPEGAEYKTRTVLVSEEPPGDPIYTYTDKMFETDPPKTQAEPRSKYVVDVYVDYYLNGVLQKENFLHTDTYEGNPGRYLVGTKPSPTPVVETTPVPAEGP